MVAVVKVACNHATQKLVLFRRIACTVDVTTCVFVAVVTTMVRSCRSFCSIAVKAYHVRLLVAVVTEKECDILFDGFIV